MYECEIMHYASEGRIGGSYLYITINLSFFNCILESRNVYKLETVEAKTTDLKNLKILFIED